MGLEEVEHDADEIPCSMVVGVMRRTGMGFVGFVVYGLTVYEVQGLSGSNVVGFWFLGVWGLGVGEQDRG